MGGESESEALGDLLRAGLHQHRRQVAHLLRLRRCGADTAQARQVLDALGDCLDVMRGHARRLQISQVHA